MASKTITNPFIRHFAKRGYAQAQTCIKVPTLHSSVMSNRILVTALDNGSAVTRVCIAFKAGSRYEPPSESGISHVLRSAAGLTTSCANTFILTRKLAQIGASVTASGDREFIYYTLETTQENLPSALECLNNMISNPEFRPWELEDNLPRLKYDISSLPPQVRAVDLLHKAAFRRGLGNSIFISPKRIGSISSESLRYYSGCTLLPSRCAIAVVGDTIDKGQLVAQALALPVCGEIQPEPSRYFSGEARKEMGGDLAHVAIALQGAPAGTPQALALAIGAKALGNGPVTKWGNDNSPLAKMIGNIGPFAVAGFNVSYSDAGLFGAILSVPKDEACTAVKCVAKLLKQPALTNAAIIAGKNQLKTQLLSEGEDATSLAESLAAQLLYTNSAKSPAELVADIDQISESAVCSALSSAASTRFSIGAAGNLSFVPFVDEL